MDGQHVPRRKVDVADLARTLGLLFDKLLVHSCVQLLYFLERGSQCLLDKSLVAICVLPLRFVANKAAVRTS